MKDLLLKPKMIHELTVQEKAFVLDKLCAEIYIARNISMNNDTILDCLKKIDKLYRTPSEGEEYES
jgi:hypothetical protein